MQLILLFRLVRRVSGYFMSFYFIKLVSNIGQTKVVFY
jgi:hypothetical protein